MENKMITCEQSNTTRLDCNKWAHYRNKCSVLLILYFALNFPSIEFSSYTYLCLPNLNATC